MTDLRTFEQITAADGEAVGGKGLSLGLMAAAGLPVPPGFCVTSAAFRRRRGKGLDADDDLGGRIAAAYRGLGGGRVAVRSSATAEDGVVTSFAGQQETVLGVQGEREVCAAVARCWASLDTDRAVAYRRKQGVSDDGLAMAVVVQRLVEAEVAGVLFTRDPLDPDGRRMLVEASWGLGESVVSGRVTPDRFHLDRDTGAVKERHISSKKEQFTADGPRPVPPEKQDAPCLDDTRLAELAELGRRVEAFYGGPRDVEWAWADGRFWLLQARPITTAGAAEREQVRREELAALRARAEPGGTVWARFNLSETLPEPTPMTWAIVRRFMSGRGGFGRMYRDLGYRPHPSLDEDGVYDLVAGRPYCNLSREPRFYAGWQPLEHPFAVLKADPRKALYPPPPAANFNRVSPFFWLILPARLPWLFIDSVLFAMRLGNLIRDFAGRFRREILPPFNEECVRAEADDLGPLDAPALLERLEHWVRRALYDFARESLKPTALAAVAMGNVERFLHKRLGPERAPAALGELSMGARPDPEADLPTALTEFAAGRVTRDDFLRYFAWRGSQEMELSQPRWGEDPSALDRMTAHAPREPAAEAPGPEGWWEKIAAEAKLTAAQRAALLPDVQALHTYLGLRETAKHYLMRGYAQIRRVLVELDRRYRLQGGVFFLTPEELPRLTAGEDLTGLIASRKQRRTAALSLEAPPVLFSDDLEALGRPVAVEGADELHGAPLSAGVAEGPALVLEQPDVDAMPAEPYILVCPSTDPAWVPLFVQAKGLVMETGGVLSHGAIVAREFGLPAVGGLPGVVRRLRTGQRLRVDGGRGAVTVLRNESRNGS
jgi:pyruvate,water dikinase